MKKEKIEKSPEKPSKEYKILSLNQEAQRRKKATTEEGALPDMSEEPAVSKRIREILSPPDVKPENFEDYQCPITHLFVWFEAIQTLSFSYIFYLLPHIPQSDGIPQGFQKNLMCLRGGSLAYSPAA